MSIRKAFRLTVVSLAVLALAAPLHAGRKKPAPTEPGTYKAWGPDIDQIEIVKTFRFADCDRIFVQPFDTSATPLPDAKENTYEPVRKVLVSATEGFVQGLRGNVEPKVEIEEKPEAASGALIIRGKVVVMDPGSRAARYWAGFGAGAAKTKIEGEIVDGRSGEVLVRFTQERRSGVGVMGGDYEGLMQRNLNAIGEDVANILKSF